MLFMHLIRTFIPAGAVLASITTAAVGSSEPAVETPIPTTAVAERAAEAIVTVTPIPAPSPIRPVAVTRRRPRRLAAHRMRPSAVA
jgi:hypothetical protein